MNGSEQHLTSSGEQKFNTLLKNLILFSNDEEQERNQSTINEEDSTLRATAPQPSTCQYFSSL